MIRFPILITCIVAASVATVVPSIGSNHGRTESSSHISQSVAAADPDASNLVFDITDQFHGVARPSQYADLPSLVRGTISTIHVQEGQSIRKGAPLITLDNRVPKAHFLAATVKAQFTGALRRAKVDYRMAESRIKRLQAVVNQGAAASFELEEAEGVRDQASAAIEQQRDIIKLAEAEQQLAEAQLDQYTISAPFDGTIIEIHQKSGTVDLSVPLIAIANLSILEVEMHLPSRMFGTVRRGDSIELRAGSPVSKVLIASVVSVSPIINSASDTFRCLLRTANPDTESPAGFSVVLNADMRHEKSGKRSRTADTGSGKSVPAGPDLESRRSEIVESFR